MKPGDKVIYFKSYNFEPPLARIGYLRMLSPYGDASVTEEPDGKGFVCVARSRVHPYTDAHWSAWLQWQQNARLLDQQHKRLMAGKAPEELLHLNLF